MEWWSPLLIIKNLCSNALFCSFYEHSNIGNEIKWVNKNHFLSSTLCTSVKISKYQDWNTPTSQTVSAQASYFGQTNVFGISELNRTKSKQVNKNHFLYCATCISVKESEFKNLSRPILKIVSPQASYFG